MQTVETISKIVRLREFIEDMTYEERETALKLAAEALISANKDMVEKNELLLIEKVYEMQESLYNACFSGRIEINNFDAKDLIFSEKIKEMMQDDPDFNIDKDFSMVCGNMTRYLEEDAEETDKYEDTEELIKAILDKCAGRA